MFTPIALAGISMRCEYSCLVCVQTYDSAGARTPLNLAPGCQPLLFVAGDAGVPAHLQVGRSSQVRPTAMLSTIVSSPMP
jgi:hypothetical protein